MLDESIDDEDFLGGVECAHDAADEGFSDVHGGGWPTGVVDVLVGFLSIVWWRLTDRWMAAVGDLGDEECCQYETKVGKNQ